MPGWEYFLNQLLLLLSVLLFLLRSILGYHKGDSSDLLGSGLVKLWKIIFMRKGVRIMKHLILLENKFVVIIIIRHKSCCITCLTCI